MLIGHPVEPYALHVNNNKETIFTRVSLTYIHSEISPHHCCWLPFLVVALQIHYSAIANIKADNYGYDLLEV